MTTKAKKPKKAQASQVAVTGRVQVQVIADVNITAPIAKRLVDIELMKKIGQMIMAEEPEILIGGQKIFWKVPFLVVAPEDDPNEYPTGTYALVDAISGIYIMSNREIEELKAASDPILDKLYPGLIEWADKVRKARGKSTTP